MRELVDRPVDEDSLRNALACTPCYSAGVIVCPTQMGVLVAINALDGALFVDLLLRRRRRHGLGEGVVVREPSAVRE